jgi:DNA-binding beta-propeller fold protein YncE
VESPAAWGLAQRGHVFGFSFGGAGEGDGQFDFEGHTKLEESAGVAVDEATGDVYVVDRGNDRVEQFKPILGNEGEPDGQQFVAAWGWGVQNGKEEYELCTTDCRAGLAGAGRGQLKEAGPIAVDNSSGGEGGVYVGADASAKRPDVQRFSVDGEKPLGKLPDELEGRLDGLAMDMQGRVWLYRGEEEETGTIEAFSNAKSPVALEPVYSSPLACPKPGFAVDARGENFYVGHELLDGEGECPAVVEREAAAEGTPLEGKDARPVVTAKLNGEEVLNSAGTAISELDRQGTNGIAVDQASAADTPLGEAAKGDVYVDNGTAVAVFGATGALIQRFGAGLLERGMGVAIDARSGDVYVVDAGEDKVDVFRPEPPDKPLVEDLAAQDLTPSEARLSGEVDPNGSDTRYYFQYGTVDCATDPSGCTDSPQAPGTDLGSGFGDHSVGVTLKGLAPAATYYYRLVATSSSGVAEASQSLESFSTLPSSAGLLADGRAWELVSPAEKDGAGIEPLAREGSLIQAAADGEAVTYIASGPVVSEPAGNRGPEPTQVISARTNDGWSSEDAVTPHDKGEGLEIGQPSEYRVFSADLALSLAQPPGGGDEPLEAPPLAEGATEKTLYVRDDPNIEPSPGEQRLYGEARASAGVAPGFVPLVTPQDVSAKTESGERSRFGGQLEFLDATSDLSHVVFESKAALLAGSEAGLYEWQSGAGLQLVSVLHDGTPAVEPALGDESINVRGAISEDGSRVFFTGEGEEGEARGLYMRDTSRDETIRINAAQGVVEPTGEEAEVAFQAATPDGSKVFFSDTAPLTPESTQRQGREADLYECEIVEREGKLACELKDLTPLPAGGSADVLNVIPGISEDGSDVYFVANGVLAPGAEPGHCVHQSLETAPPGATCNLYRWDEGAITFIAALSNEDSGDWGSLHGPGSVGGYAVNRADLADLTASVSPDGQYLAFMSQMQLVGYETLDAEHAAEGIHDEEVYLYDASTNLLTCASCNPNGHAVGVHDVEHAGEGQGLVVDRRGDWSGEYLAGSIPGWTPLGVDDAIHQPRYLSDSGRLFFDSPDQLVPQATNGKEDVFEYEPAGVGNCTQANGCVALISSGSARQESVFLEASVSGDDAFFLTAQPLVAADHDSNYDIYDARVCTESSPCLTSESSSQRPCEASSSCDPASVPLPSFGLPATLTVRPAAGATANQAPGSSTAKSVSKPKSPTRSQLLVKALDSCRRQKNRRKRLACEKLARRRYQPKPKAAKSKVARSSRKEHR